jgi:hypothetical protein
MCRAREIIAKSEWDTLSPSNAYNGASLNFNDCMRWNARDINGPPNRNMMQPTGQCAHPGALPRVLTHLQKEGTRASIEFCLPRLSAMATVADWPLWAHNGSP